MARHAAAAAAAPARLWRSGLAADGLLWPALVIALLLAPSIGGPVGVKLVERILVLAVLGLAVDILHGYAGLPTFGQGAYFGAAAYTAGELVTRLGWENPLPVAVASVLIATLLAGLFGLIALRASQLYFLLVTFAFSQLLATMASQFRVLQTPGVNGIAGITFSELLPGVPWRGETIFWVTAATAVVVLFATATVVRARFGVALLAMQEGRARMEALGFDTWLLAYAAFVLSGLVAGIAGVLHAYSNGLVVPDDLGVPTSALGLLVVLIGGSRRVGGPVAGAALVVLVQYFAAGVLPTRWPLVMGVLYVLAAFWTRQGVAGLTVDLVGRAVGRRPPAVAEDAAR